MPTAVLVALHAKIPQLRAEELLELSSVALRTSGRRIEDEAAKRLHADWVSLASGGHRYRRRSGRSVDDLLQQAQALGIEVVKEPKP